LQQVFFNLLTNAVKFTPARGEVRVVCRHRQGHVEVGVTDTGIGIKPEFLPMAFERFKQQDGRITRQFQGLGLGLAIARHLVELHGGTIRAESVGEGRGATFTVELPRAILRIAALSTGLEERRLRSGSGATSAAIVAAPPAKVLAGVTVMVTDDELDARDVVKRMLERRGAKVLTCGSAAETLERLARERPNILVCDIGMPEVDGYALIGKVRTSSPEQGGATPAIALTAFARPEDRTRALLAGFQMHMSKPVDPEELVAGIRRVATAV
jgi:CheY-like chemotaxis protein